MITDPSGIFTESIKAPNTSIIPLVVFVREGSLKKTISTNSVNIDFGEDILLYFEPLLLNIPSIRESVDFENRNFKIGNISLSISNSAHKNNDRFSDSLPDIINSTCMIYWKVPRAKTLFDCLSVYTGKVKRMTHDDTKVTLQIEDQTQENLHKDLPIETVSTDLEILDKYKNKPIPFVYGENKKHKSIIRPKNDGTNEFEVIPDSLLDLEGYDSRHPLKILFENKYFHIPMNLNKYSNDFDDNRQYIVEDNNSFTLKRVFDSEDEPLNTVGKDEIEAYLIDKPTVTINDNIYTNVERYYMNESAFPTDIEVHNFNHQDQELNVENLINNDYFDFAKVKTVGYEDNCNIYKNGGQGGLNNNFNARKIQINFNYNPLLNSNDFENKKSNALISFVLNKIESNFTDGSELTPNVRVQIFITNTNGDLEPSGNGYLNYWNYNDAEYFYTKNEDYKNSTEQTAGISRISVHIIPSNVNPEDENGFNNVTLNAKFYSFDAYSYGKIKNIYNNNFYVDIKGRKGQKNVDYLYENIRRTTFNHGIINGSIFDQLYVFETFKKDNPLMLNMLKNYNGYKYVEIYSEDDVFIGEGRIFVIEELPTKYVFTIDGFTYTQNLNNIKIKIPHSHIELPCDIMRHLLINDIGFNGTIRQDELEIARNEHNGFYFSISQTEKINSKELFENIAKQSKFFPKFRNDGSFGFNTIKDIYTKDDAESIEIKDIINYKFDRTKIDDLKTKIKVIYGKDNITNEYLKSTPYLEASNYFEGYENSYYGLQNDHIKSTLDFEAEYIQHEQTALLLRNFLIAWYANQHNIVSVDLPLKYMKYEIGDVVQFDSLINNLKLYGEDYTEIVSRNGQDIYPYFMIMETNKSIDKISFKLVQLHKNIVPEEQLQDDEVNRSIKPPKGGFIAEQVENALNKNPSLANIQEITNER
tara:strand:+ start:978 stop:3758 length:2781 start_codon:yes stop_codon:yes gene_type:complete